jgi:hypothetical protein
VGLVVGVGTGGSGDYDDGLVDGEGDGEEGEPETDCYGEFSGDSLV